MRTLTRDSFFEDLTLIANIDRAKAHEIVDLFFEEIAAALERGEDVCLRGFGKFERHNKPARVARNPRTLEKCLISARTVVTFKSSAKLLSKCQVKRKDEKLR